MNRVQRPQLRWPHPSSLTQHTVVDAQQLDPPQHLLATRDRLRTTWQQRPRYLGSR